MCSTITSAPSTTIPKSIAPSECRLAGIPARYMQMKAKSSDSRMVSGASTDERAVHYDHETDRAEREQVGRNPRQVHADEGEEQRQWYGQRRQQRRARASEEEQQHPDHDHQPLDERARDRPERVADEVGAVIQGDDLHAGGQAPVVQIVQRRLDL